AHLIEVSLRELRFDDLDDYCFSAMTTQGSIDDFRYLLPRIFQGIAEENCLCAPETIFDKLNYAKWLTWHQDEIVAIRTYLHTLWQVGLNSFPLDRSLPAFCEIESLLASIARTGEALEHYLNIWTETKTLQADENLVQFVTMYGDEFSDGGTMHEAFWEDSKPQADALRVWLLQPDTIRRISNAASLLRNDGYEQLFAPALEVLLNQCRT
ncbi:MAG: hypothetical protein WB424_13185, partial [Terracidiphilus sp.]